MAQEIESKIIGKLKQNSEFEDWWESKEIEIPFFDNKKFIITFMDFEPENDDAFIDEADLALTYFLKLNEKDRNSISQLVYENCMNFLEEIEFDEADEPLRQIKDKNDIWNFVYPDEISVQRRPYNDKDIYVVVGCNCDWEQEHGLQLVFRQGKKLTRISDIDGHLTDADAYDTSDEEDDLLSKFICD